MVQGCKRERDGYSRLIAYARYLHFTNNGKVLDVSANSIPESVRCCVVSRAVQSLSAR